MQEIEAPQGLIDTAGSNSYAAIALSYITIANGFTANSTYFEPPSKAIVPTKTGTVSDTTAWTYNYEAYSWSITYGSYEDDDYYYWEIWFDDNGELYDSCKYIGYREAKDRTSGRYQWYSDCGANPYWVWTWNLSALDVYTLTMESESYSFEIVVNPDGSGTMTSYYGDLGSQAQYTFT